MQFREFSCFDDLPAGYVKLFCDAERKSLFYGYDWFDHLKSTALESGQAVRVCALEDGAGNPRAAMVLRDEKLEGNPFESRILSSCSNFYTMTYAPTVACDEESVVDSVAELVTAIMDGSRTYDVIRIGPMDAEALIFRQTYAAFRQSGLICRPYFIGGNWYEPINGDSFDDYLKKRPSQLRNTFKRRANKLAKMGGYRYVLTTGLDGLDDAIAAYSRVYSESWKEAERFPRFIPGLIRLSAEKGILRLGVAYLDDVPAAAQIWLLDGDKAVIYKLAYDERFKEYSLGTVLTMNLMKHVIDVDRVREVDYGSGDDPYKKDWMMHRRERWGIVAHNPRTVRGLIGGLAQNAKRSVSRIRRRPTAPNAFAA